MCHAADAAAPLHLISIPPLTAVAVSSAETVAKTGMILLVGEITSRAVVDYQKIVRDAIRCIGYDDSSKGTVVWGNKAKIMALIKN